MINIFDTNSHLHESKDGFSNYLLDAVKYNIIGTAETILPHQNNELILDDVLKKHTSTLETFAIPFFNGKNLINLKLIYNSKKYIIKGVKIHPRFSNIKYTELINFSNFFEFLIENNLFLNLCTYCHTDSNYPEVDILSIIAKIKNKYPALKIILLHAGDVRAVEFGQFSRHFKDVYLDFSYTMCKYSSNYIDDQIKFCFQELDQKCLIGSDYPFFNLNVFRSRAEELTQCITLDKKENIFFKNALKIYER
jgi:predicted TIM-barrel fold metal-dependent hydrolase